MKNFLKTTSFKILALMLGVCLMGVFFAAVTNNGTSPLTSVAGVVFSPLQRLASFAAERFDNFSGAFVSSSEYRERIKELEGKVIEYQSQLVDYEKLKKKVESYENFLEVKNDNPDYKFATASVIGRDSADVFGSFTVNAGSNDGVKVNCPVIYGEHLVGVVKEVNLTSCVVYTIFNPKVNISAYEIRSGEIGYVNSNTDLALKGRCMLSGLDGNSVVTSGGIVCTSGIGGIYPRGLIIGTVRNVEADEANVSSNAIIEPDIDITTLQDVFIITDFGVTD
ncbi:MAG: rod shape-determining protein MreC [Clostridiales bacterium]|nr:rod shape-determining protein MreC [Clostridiales bacterium]